MRRLRHSRLLMEMLVMDATGLSAPAQGTANNQGDWRSLDNDYVTGGLVMPLATPTITQQPAGQEVCPGQTAVFAVSAAAEGAVARPSVYRLAEEVRAIDCRWAEAGVSEP